MAKRMSGADAQAGRVAMYCFTLWFWVYDPKDLLNMCFDYFREFKRFLDNEQKLKVLTIWKHYHSDSEDADFETAEAQLKSIMEAVFV